LSQRKFERELEREQLKARISIALRALLVVVPLGGLLVYAIYFRGSQGPLHDGALLVGTIDSVRVLESDAGAKVSLVVALPESTAEVRPHPSVPNLPGQRVRVRELVGPDSKVRGYRLEGLAPPDLP
jgi:hypothetical protein